MLFEEELVNTLKSGAQIEDRIDDTKMDETKKEEEVKEIAPVSESSSQIQTTNTSVYLLSTLHTP